MGPIFGANWARTNFQQEASEYMDASHRLKHQSLAYNVQHIVWKYTKHTFEQVIKYGMQIIPENAHVAVHL